MLVDIVMKSRQSTAAPRPIAPAGSPAAAGGPGSSRGTQVLELAGAAAREAGQQLMVVLQQQGARLQQAAAQAWTRCLAVARAQLAAWPRRQAQMATFLQQLAALGARVPRALPTQRSRSAQQVVRSSRDPALDLQRPPAPRTTGRGAAAAAAATVTKAPRKT